MKPLDNEYRAPQAGLLDVRGRLKDSSPLTARKLPYILRRIISAGIIPLLESDGKKRKEKKDSHFWPAPSPHQMVPYSPNSFTGMVSRVLYYGAVSALHSPPHLTLKLYNLFLPS